MVLYKKPWYYTLSHIVLGICIAWFLWLAVPVVGYQVGQYAYDVRIFPLEGVIESGNTFQYTGLKLFEVGVGYCIGTLLKTCYAS